MAIDRNYSRGKTTQLQNNKRIFEKLENFIAIALVHKFYSWRWYCVQWMSISFEEIEAALMEWSCTVHCMSTREVHWRFWLKKPSVMLISIIVKRAQTSKTEGWSKLFTSSFFFLWLFDLRQTPYLQVEVSYLLGVQVEDPIQDLLEELSGLLLAQRLLLCQEVKELPAGHAAQEERKKEREREKEGRR